MTSEKQINLQEPIVVLHLVWRDAGHEQFETFIESYKKFKAGCNHELLIAFKGFEQNADLRTRYLETLEGVSCQTFDVPNKGKDIFAYKNVVSRLSLECSAVLFLNSSAEFLCENWLLKLHSVLKNKSVGAVGATGSWERREPLDTWPHYHLRANAFFADFDLLKQLDWGGLDEALAFEAGPRSLYSQVLSMGLDVSVVGKDGTMYLADDWKVSGTFRSFGQRNLMIADNRTRDYSDTDEVKKLWFHILAWYDFEPGPHPDKRGSFSYIFKRFFYMLKNKRALRQFKPNEML